MSAFRMLIKEQLFRSVIKIYLISSLLVTRLHGHPLRRPNNIGPLVTLLTGFTT